MKFSLLCFIFFIIVFRLINTSPNFVNGQFLKIRGTVNQEPKISKGNYIFNLSGIKVVTNQNKNINYSDYLEIKGQWKNGEIINATIDKINPSTNLLIKIRNYLINFYETALPGLNGIVLSAIILGSKSDLPYYFQTKLQYWQASYLLNASGIKIAILSGFLLNLLLLKLKRPKALILIVTFIWFYTLISGLETSTIKASIIITIAYTSQIFGRVTSSLKNTTIAFLIMLFIWPYLLFDFGFILSFSVTLSIILFNQKIANFFKFIPEILRQDVSISIAAQLGTIPIIFFIFQEFNLLSPLINLLVIWTISPIMLLGSLAGAVSFISPTIAKLILIPIGPLISYFVTILSL